MGSILGESLTESHLRLNLIGCPNPYLPRTFVIPTYSSLIPAYSPLQAKGAKGAAHTVGNVEADVAVGQGVVNVVVAQRRLDGIGRRVRAIEEDIDCRGVDGAQIVKLALGQSWQHHLQVAVAIRLVARLDLAIGESILFLGRLIVLIVVCALLLS